MLASLVYDPCDVPPDVFMVPLITSQLCLQLVVPLRGPDFFLLSPPVQVGGSCGDPAEAQTATQQASTGEKEIHDRH